MTLTKNKVVHEPFLRWTGSKRWFTKEHLRSLLPTKFKNYHEPFLGAGAVFFFIYSKMGSNLKYYLSDINEELINCYKSLRDNPDKTIYYLKKFNNTEEDYYSYRSLLLEDKDEKAARFIYLNRTSFNGIYRVNSKGIFNVPYGKRQNVDIVTPELLSNVSSTLQKVNLQSSHFEDTIKNINKGDLVFLDPPYTVAHENNGFIEYNQHLFSWNDQIALRDYISKIIDKEAYFILTNANHTSILELYKDIGQIKKLTRLSKVGGRNKTRKLYNEVVIYNTYK